MKILLILLLALIGIGCEEESEIQASLREAGYEKLMCRPTHTGYSIRFEAQVVLGDNPILARCIEGEDNCQFEGVTSTKITCQEYRVSRDMIIPTLFPDHEIWVFDIFLDIKE